MSTLSHDIIEGVVTGLIAAIGLNLSILIPVVTRALIRRVKRWGDKR